jgi:hypothetical protein
MLYHLATCATKTDVPFYGSLFTLAKLGFQHKKLGILRILKLLIFFFSFLLIFLSSFIYSLNFLSVFFGYFTFLKKTKKKIPNSAEGFIFASVR